MTEAESTSTPRRRPGRPPGSTRTQGRGPAAPRPRAGRITVARLPEEARGQCPSGLVGEAIADWYLTWDAGRRYAICEYAPLASVVERLEELVDRLERLGDAVDDALDERPRAAGQAPGPLSQAEIRALKAASRPDHARPDPFDPDATPASLAEQGYALDEPDVPEGVALPAPEYQRVLDFCAWARRQSHRPQEVEGVVLSVIRGRRYNPATGTEELDPPWTTLLSRWDQLLYARLAARGIVPEQPEETLTLPPVRPAEASA